MTPRQASKIIQAKLHELGLDYKTSAHTISFSDLARASCIFVRIHNWNPGKRGQHWEALELVANRNDFCIESHYD